MCKRIVFESKWKISFTWLFGNFEALPHLGKGELRLSEVARLGEPEGKPVIQVLPHLGEGEGGLRLGEPGVSRRHCFSYSVVCRARWFLEELLVRKGLYPVL